MKNKNVVNLKISADTSDIDKAIEKVNLLKESMEDCQKVLFIESDNKLSKEAILAEQERIESITGMKTCILHNGYRLSKIENCNNETKETKFEIWGKSEFIKYLGIDCGMKKEYAEEKWIDISKGHNFVIASYSEKLKGHRIMSVDFFDSIMK